jgi:hypothetical protein
VEESDDSDDDLGNPIVGDEVVIRDDDGDLGDPIVRNGNVNGETDGLRRCIAEAGVQLAGTSAALYAQAVLQGGDGFNEHMKNLATQRFAMLKPILWLSHIDTKAKLLLYKSMILSIFTYGCQAIIPHILANTKIRDYDRFQY